MPVEASACSEIPAITTLNSATGISNLLNPAQAAEDALTAKLNQLKQRGCLLSRNQMDLEELLNSDSEHGSGVETGTNEEIVEALQGMALKTDELDHEEASESRTISRKEALEAAEVLQSLVSDSSEEWACTLEGVLMTMT